jgi:hypothetical protein
MGDVGKGALHLEYELTVKQRNQNQVRGPIVGPAPRRTGRQTVGRNVTNELASLHCKLQTRPLVREGTLHEE